VGTHTSMKAFVVEHLNQAGSLQNVPDPQTDKTDIVVRISAAGINPVDWKSRDLYNRPLPFTLGQDFAGTVVAVGSMVNDYRLGDRVFGIARRNGAYAELTLCPTDDLTSPISHIPDGVGDSDAAAVPTPGLTAMACFEKLPLSSGSCIAIFGATGALGQIAVQIARNNGFKVVGIGSKLFETYMRELGCIEYVARDTQTPAEIAASLRRFAPQGFDAVIDAVSDAKAIQSSGELVRDQGILLSTNHSIEADAFDPSKITALDADLTGSRASSHEGLRNLAKMLESKAVRAPRFVERDFSDALLALDQIKHRTIHEKVILTFR
jgi:NADPH:quinone reductase-like Zn-dependent oxidoreductase